MTTLATALLAVLLASPVAAAGDLEHPRGLRPGGPPAFLQEIFPPSLVMRHQEEIGLTPAQRDAITQAMTDTQAKLVPLRWRSEAEAEQLADLLRRERVDEAAALAQSEAVLRIEHEIKQAHLALLVRIKNQLTAEQQRTLRRLRAKERRVFRRDRD